MLTQRNKTRAGLNRAERGSVCGQRPKQAALRARFKSTNRFPHHRYVLHLRSVSFNHTNTHKQLLLICPSMSSILLKPREESTTQPKPTHHTLLVCVLPEAPEALMCSYVYGSPSLFSSPSRDLWTLLHLPHTSGLAVGVRGTGNNINWWSLELLHLATRHRNYAKSADESVITLCSNRAGDSGDIWMWWFAVIKHGSRLMCDYTNGRKDVRGMDDNHDVTMFTGPSSLQQLQEQIFLQQLSAIVCAAAVDLTSSSRPWAGIWCLFILKSLILVSIEYVFLFGGHSTVFLLFQPLKLRLFETSPAPFQFENVLFHPEIFVFICIIQCMSESSYHSCHLHLQCYLFHVC